MLKETKKIELFNIPLYATSEDIFNEKWNSYYNNFINKAPLVEDKEETIDWLKRNEKGATIWKFNQIYGYITISLRNADIWFGLYESKVKRRKFNSHKKIFIENSLLQNYHFYARNMNNEQIILKIMQYIKSIEKNILKGKYYLDIKTFEYLVNYINFEKMIHS